MKLPPPPQLIFPTTFKLVESKQWNEVQTMQKTCKCERKGSLKDSNFRRLTLQECETRPEKDILIENVCFHFQKSFFLPYSCNFYLKNFIVKLSFHEIFRCLRIEDAPCICVYKRVVPEVPDLTKKTQKI